MSRRSNGPCQISNLRQQFKINMPFVTVKGHQLGGLLSSWWNSSPSLSRKIGFRVLLVINICCFFFSVLLQSVSHLSQNVVTTSPAPALRQKMVLRCRAAALYCCWKLLLTLCLSLFLGFPSSFWWIPFNLWNFAFNCPLQAKFPLLRCQGLSGKVRSMRHQIIFLHQRSHCILHVMRSLLHSGSLGLSRCRGAAVAL